MSFMEKQIKIIKKTKEKHEFVNFLTAQIRDLSYKLLHRISALCDSQGYRDYKVHKIKTLYIIIYKNNQIKTTFYQNFLY